ncbi:hypothetical protein PVAND_005214 [Polypedilum vanderplanki]|uniref:Uncharacterized protein n=1 Tax=Polypedilum vanderplanki TaxID=319348 RepID=A0A9J6C1E1_POLVA|nr:hypothetical protein PVAND_005214 [Polypedilum vanderplanki]
MAFLERITAGELQEYTKMLDDILTYKFNNGSNPSDGMLFNTLISTVEMLDKCRNPWIDCDVYSVTFHFFANMDFSSPKFIEYFLDSEIMDYIERIFKKGPSYIIEEAISVIFNILTLASDEHIPKFHELECVQSLFDFKCYVKMNDLNLQNIGKLAIQTLELLYQKSQELLARKSLSRA